MVLTLLVCLAGIIINIWTLKDGHNWGGDFAQYLIHAQNLLGGKPYVQGIMLDEAIVYPPGYPLLIAPFIKTFGLNLIILKSLNIIFWYGSLFFLYLIAKQRNIANDYKWVIALLACSSFFFVFKQNTLSDIPFMLAVTAALWALESRHITTALVLMFAAVLLRSAGLVLCASAIFYFSFLKRDVRSAFLYTLPLILAVTIQTIMTGVHPAFLRTFLHAPIERLIHLAQEASIVWQSMVWLLCPGQTPITSWIFTGLEAVFIIISPLLYLGLIVLFIKKFKTLDPIECFCCFYIGMLFVWASFGGSPQNFTRYTLPVVGLLLMLAIQYIRHVNWSKWILGVLLVLNIVNIAFIFNFNDDEILHYRPNRELLAWVKTNLNADEHYMIWEPRTVALLTQRVGTTLAWIKFNAPPKWQGILHQWNVHYVILDGYGDKAMIDQFKSFPWAQAVWSNNTYVILKISS